MPTVPQYNEGQVKNTDLPSVKFSANATGASFGGTQAEALGQAAHFASKAGGTLTNIGLQEQEEENKALVQDALSQDQATARAYLTNNVFNQEGKNAMGLLPKAQAELEKISKGRMESFKSDRQKELYQSFWRNVQDGHIAHVQTFQSSAAKQYERVSKQQLTEARMRDAQLYWNDDNYVKDAYDDGLANSKNIAAPWGPDAVKNAEAEYNDRFYSGIISAAFEQSPASALEVLNKYGDKLTPKTFNTLDKTLKKAVESQIIQGAAAQAVSGGLDVVQAREQISKTVPADQVENAMSVYKTMQSERESVAKAQQVARENDAYMKQAQDPLAPAPIWMDAKQIAAYNDNAQKLINGVDENTKRITAGKLYREFSDNPTKFAKEVSLYSYAASLKGEDLNRLINLRDDVLKQKAVKTPGLDKAIADVKEEAIKWSGFKINTNDPSDVIKEKQDGLDQFIAAFTDRLMQLPDEKRADWKIQKEIREELLKDVVLSRAAWFTRDENLGPKYKLESGAKELNSPVKVEKEEDLNQLPFGTRFIAPDGSIRIKK